MFKKTKKSELALLVAFPVLAVAFSLGFRVNFLVSILLFFLPLMIFLSFKNKQAVVKTALFSLLFVIPLAVIIDYIAVVGEAWYVSTMFDWRLFGLAPIEDFIWGFCIVYSVVIFYEHFYDKTGQERLDRHMKWLMLIIGILLLIFLDLLVINKDLLNIPYVYFWIALVLVIFPIGALFFRFRNLANKFFKVAAYFAFLTLLEELTAIYLGHWWFPGKQFIGWVEIFNLGFPLEELVFYILFGSIAILAIYEIFDDDRK